MTINTKFYSICHRLAVKLSIKVWPGPPLRAPPLRLGFEGGQPGRGVDNGTDRNISIQTLYTLKAFLAPFSHNNTQTTDRQASQSVVDNAVTSPVQKAI